MSAEILDFKAIKQQRAQEKKKQQKEVDSGYSLDAANKMFEEVFSEPKTDTRSADEIAGEMLYFLVNDLIYKGFDVHSAEKIPADLTMIGVTIAAMIHRMRGEETAWVNYLDAFYKEDSNLQQRIHYWLALQELAHQNNS